MYMCMVVAVVLDILEGMEAVNASRCSCCCHTVMANVL